MNFPKTGLGNLLLIWARARIFSDITKLPLVTSLWWGLRPGAWIRNERKKRFYWGYFKESNCLMRFYACASSFFLTKVNDPSIDSCEIKNSHKKQIFIFRKVVTGDDLFFFIRQHRQFIIKELYNVLQTKIVRELDKHPLPYIGVHIRRGDFKYGNPITPNDYFISAIQAVRESIGEVWPVTIFTDAEYEELSDILLLPDISISPDKPDIIDLLLLSRSRVLILSKSSTFSYWAGFLSDAWLIRPRSDWQKHLRMLNDPREIYYDGNNNSVFSTLSDKESNFFF